MSVQTSSLVPYILDGSIKSASIFAPAPGTSFVAAHVQRMVPEMVHGSGGRLLRRSTVRLYQHGAPRHGSLGSILSGVKNVLGAVLPVVAPAVAPLVNAGVNAIPGGPEALNAVCASRSGDGGSQHEARANSSITSPPSDEPQRKRRYVFQTDLKK